MRASAGPDLVSSCCETGPAEARWTMRWRTARPRAGAGYVLGTSGRWARDRCVSLCVCTGKLPCRKLLEIFGFGRPGGPVFAAL